MDPVNLQRFLSYCQGNNYYTGYIEGVGEVHHWETLQYTTDYPGNNPNAFARDSVFSGVGYFPIIVPDVNAYSTNVLHGVTRNQAGFLQVMDGADHILGLGGTIATGVSMTNRPITIGPEYNVINQGGTRVRNTNRTYTNSGELAKTAGKRIFFISIGIDGIITTTKVYNAYSTPISNSYTKDMRNREVKNALVEGGISIAVNTGIFALGCVCPPAGVAAGILVLIFQGSANRPVINRDPNRDYIMPADKTRVVLPHRELPIQNRRNRY